MYQERLESTPSGDDLREKSPARRATIVGQLRAAGSVAAEEEADDLIAAAATPAALLDLVERRLAGEPLAWITGSTRVDGVVILVDAGVYVPRWQTGFVARHALVHLPSDGTAVDLCTGAGAIARYLSHHHPGAVVVATEIDPAAARCAARNGVDVRVGDLYAPLDGDLADTVDVVTAVPPYVPGPLAHLLPRDVVAHEPQRALLGGQDGLDVVRRIVSGAGGWLRPGGHLVLEVGADQVDEVVGTIAPHAGLRLHADITDGDGDPCGLCLARPAS